MSLITRIDQNKFAVQCMVCGTPLGGLPSVVFRLCGIRRSPRNPNVCSRCSTHAKEQSAQITVLFADLCSFTELAHQLGARRTHQVVDAFLRMTAQVLTQYDAYLDKFLGDGVMAIFNVPIRRSDHARRAVAAAAEMQSRMVELREQFGLDLYASIGIATGSAWVGRLASDDARAFTAIGNVVNLSARLEAQARAGEILLDDGVFATIADVLPRTRPEGLTLKGFPSTVQAYRVAPNTRIKTIILAGEQNRANTITLGSLIFAILGAPCAAAVAVAPIASVLGFGAIFGASSAIWFLDETPIRIPILLLATLAALANLYTIWRALRLQTGATKQPLHRLRAMLTPRTLVVLATSIVTLGVVGFESFAHGHLMFHAFP